MKLAALLVVVQHTAVLSFVYRDRGSRPTEVGYQDRSHHRLAALSRPNDEFFVVSWDGCLTNAVEWRIETALHVAADVWPEVEIDWDDKSWLENKLAALSHVLAPENDDISVTCEYALAARLLLEEQKLDGGWSNGKTGKYASRFHPKQKSQLKKTNPIGSRPLTVGEISSNWVDGGMIRETLRARYHCNYKDPMPVLQMKVKDAVEHGKYGFPTIDKATGDVVLSCQGGKFVITVTHQVDLIPAKASLNSISIPFQMVDNAMEALKVADGVVLMVKKSETLQQLLESAPDRSVTYIFESSWPLLKKHIPLFGDNIPRKENVAQSFIQGRWLSLFLATWPSNSHPNQHSAAIMNAWTGLVDFTGFSEIVSARIVKK